MPRETFPAFVRTSLNFRIPLTGVLDTSGAVTFLLSYVVPFKATLERVVLDRKSTRLNSSHRNTSRMPSSA